MSTLALQRALVRLHYDGALVARVLADPRAALADAGLDDAERALLLAWDPRAYATDPQRRTRTLAALLEEYPATCVLVLMHARSAGPLDAFFASPQFHACVQRGAALALAFGEYLLALEVESPTRPSASVALARLEHTIAGARRTAWPARRGRQAGGPAMAADAAPAARAPQVHLAPGVAVVEVPLGALAVQQAVAGGLAARMAQQPTTVSEAVVGLATDGLPLPVLAAADREYLLIHARAEVGSPVSVERTPPELGRVLAAAAPGVARAALLAIVRAEGAASGEDESVLRSLVADGLLVADAFVEMK